MKCNNLKKNLLLLIFGLSAFCSNAQTANLIKSPTNNQVIARNVATNFANVDVDGTVDVSSGFTYITLLTYKNGAFYNVQTVPLNYISGIASFNFDQPIYAELSNYSMQLLGNSYFSLWSVDGVTAGDIYIFNGQSNIAMGSGNSFPTPNSFIRTPYSSGLWIPANTYLGGIAYQFANAISLSQNIPIGVLNAGVGGVGISYFQRNDANPTDPNTNYGQLLNLYNAAKIDSARAIIWYQGESDYTSSVATYKSDFMQLYNDWSDDYKFSGVYFFQPKACAFSTNFFDVLEALRQLKSEIPNSGIVSTGGINTQDGCHYYIAGYTTFATYMHDLIAYKMYNSGTGSGVFAPEVSTNFRFTDANKNKIEFYFDVPTDAYTWQSGAEANFVFSDPSIYITSVSLAGNHVVLNLNAPFTASSPWVGYLNAASGTPYIHNQNGQGLLSFKYRPIVDFNMALSKDEVELSATTNKCETILSWKIEHEEVRIKVEQSFDGKKFELLEAAIENDSKPHNFKTKIISGNPIVYYRLQIIGLDGDIVYSNVIKVSTNCAYSSYSIYPNPVHGNQSIKVQRKGAGNEQLQLSLVNTVGRKVLSQKIAFRDNVTHQNVDLNGIEPATYFLQIHNLNNQLLFTDKIIVK